jgi:pseudouridine synthase
VRLAKYLAHCGVASRRRSEELIAAGRVMVNGQVAQIGQTIDVSKDELRVDGTLVRVPDREHVWLVLHKPAGVMTTRADPRGRKTVFDLVEDVPGLTYVGRLDYMTEGLLLLTTDGRAANALMHPSSEVERTYVAIVRGDARAASARARGGVELEDGPVRPRRVAVRPLAAGRSEFEVTISEGRKREVRRLCKALDLHLERLIRIRYGPVQLGDLQSGHTRPLTSRELRDIEQLVEYERPASSRKRSRTDSIQD